MTMTQTTPNPKKDFEAALAQLNTLVEQIENQELPLEKALSTFEDGMKLAKQCQEALSQAEQRIRTITSETENTTSSVAVEDVTEPSDL